MNKLMYSLSFVLGSRDTQCWDFLYLQEFYAITQQVYE